MENANAIKSVTLNVAEKAWVKEVAFSFRNTITGLCKKALFFTSVPFYWLVFFTKIMHFYDANFFVFVVVASIVMSFFGKNWGVLHFLIK